jgi:hypothetical protein
MFVQVHALGGRFVEMKSEAALLALLVWLKATERDTKAA